MKKNKLSFNVIEVPLDFLFLLIAGITAYFLRFADFVVAYRPIIFELPLSLFLKILLGVSIGAIIIFTFSGLYSFKRKTLTQKISKVFSSTSFFILILIIAFFFNQRLFSSRFIVLFYWAFSLILLSLERIILNLVHHYLTRKGVIKSNIVIIGQNDSNQNLIQELKSNKNLGYQVIQSFPELNLKFFDFLEEIDRENEIDEIFLMNTLADRNLINTLINFCNSHHIVYKYTASLLETKIINFEINTIAGVPIVEIKGTRLDGWARVWKRVYDLVLTIFSLVLFIPIYIVVGIFIKLDSSGPVLVKLTRVGAKNKKFKMYKFRSMVVGADKMKKDLMSQNEREDGPLFKMKDDPRITKVGKFIRKTSIDELPQLINVLKGNISLVGPRAHEPGEVAKYDDRDLKLLAIKPGITGMAQVSGRSDLKFSEEVRLDIYYIENWNIWLDIKIILKTVKVVLFDKNAV
ncbi:sugar transferase [bacterium]|nr:sugar transferase [bacterium]